MHSNDELTQKVCDLKSEIKQLEYKYDQIGQCLQLAGIEVDDFKRNFNNGLLYIIKPKSEKRLVVLATLIKSSKEREAINNLGKVSII